MKFRPTLIALAAASLALPLAAQTPAPEAPAKLDKVEVTGTMIKRTDAETAAPVTVIRREEILRSGRRIWTSCCAWTRPRVWAVWKT